jgi:predicted GIY-YIG superfamily endonuclease
MSDGAASLAGMLTGEPHNVYRIWRRRKLLYVGVSNSWPRRLSEHQAAKAWFKDATRVTLKSYPDRAAALDAERHAIETKRPLFNIQHNRDRNSVEVEVDPDALARSLCAMGAAVCLVVLAVRWTLDAGAAWWIQARADRDGLPLQVPAPRNPFTEEPPPLAMTLLQMFIEAASRPSHPEISVGIEEQASSGESGTSALSRPVNHPQLGPTTWRPTQSQYFGAKQRPPHWPAP